MASADRTLLNTFTSAELAAMILGGTVLVAWLGFWAVGRWTTVEARSDNNEVAGILIGLLGAFYGIVLGFAIVVLFEDFRAADASVKDETTALAQIYRSATGMRPADTRRVGRAIARYSIAVRNDEWPLMRDGLESAQAHQLLGGIYSAVDDSTVVSSKQQVLYSNMTSSLGDVVAARRTRLADASQTLPGVFQVFLLFGIVVLLSFLWFFGMRNRHAQLLLAIGVASVMAFSLLLVLELAYPFSGDIAVSNEPFKLGVVGQLSPKTGIPVQSGCFRCATSTKHP
jgi:hypothetical protein